MNITILDDYHDTLRTLACFKKLKATMSQFGPIMCRVSMHWPTG